MTEETTSEQLAEIEGQAEDTPATGYTPPEGWRVLAVGEILQAGDMWVTHEGEWRTRRVGETVNDERYIRRIEPDPQAEPEPQPQPIQVREGRWRTRSGEEKNIRSCEPLKGAYYVWPWTDGFMTFQDNGLHQGSKESPNDLVEYLGPIEQQPESQPNAATIEELRSEVSYVQGLLGESRQRVTQLEELVTSLRTINEGAEKAVSGAGVVNDSLRLQLEAVKAELASVAANRQQLRVELDAAQQVPADSPELRQLRADLAEVTRERDQHLDSYQRIFGDLETIRETTKAATVEAIAEWLQPIRAVDNEHLANEALQHLPQIMRSLAGLSSPEDVD